MSENEAPITTVLTKTSGIAKNGWKIVAIISCTISALLLVIILSLQTSRILPSDDSLPVVSDSKQQNIEVPITNSEEISAINKFPFPNDIFFLSVGEASNRTLNQDFNTNIEVVELTLSYFGTDEEKTYTITMPAFDSISEPKISFKEKFGCFGVSNSGHYGYYIFKIPNGELVDSGKQYSSCVTWIDDHRVIIADKPYFNPEQTTFYILDAETNTKQIISSPLQLK